MATKRELDQQVRQIFDFGMLETFDGFYSKLRVVNRLGGPTSITRSAKDGSLQRSLQDTHTESGQNSSAVQSFIVSNCAMVAV